MCSSCVFFKYGNNFVKLDFAILYKRFLETICGKCSSKLESSSNLMNDFWNPSSSFEFKPMNLDSFKFKPMNLELFKPTNFEPFKLVGFRCVF